MFNQLQIRLTLLVVALFLAGLWAFTLLTIQHEEEHLRSLLVNQQRASAQYIADEIDSKIRLRLDSLAMIAEKLPANLRDHARLNAFLSERQAIYKLFDYGLIVIKPDLSGAYADFPAIANRLTDHWNVSPFLDVARSGQAMVGTPRIGRFSQVALVPLAVPVKDVQGRLLAILCGVTSINASHFLEPISHYRAGEGGDVLIVSPSSNLVISQSGQSKTLLPLSKIGSSRLSEHLASQTATFEDHDGQGLLRMISSQRIASANWFVLVRQPKESVQAPILGHRATALLAATAMSLLVALLTAWFIHRSLRPMRALKAKLEAVSQGNEPLSAMAVRRPDEIGSLIESFNRLQARLRADQQALHDSEAQLRTLIEALPDSVQFKDPDGRWLAYNRVAQLAFGLQDVDCHGLSDAELDALTPPHYRGALLHCQASDRLVWGHGQLSHLEETVPQPDGSVQTCDVIKVPLIDSDGQHKGLVIVGRDISERKRAENELRLLSEALRQSSEAIVLTDPERRFQYVNPGFERLFGYRLEEVRGRSLSLLLPDASPNLVNNALVSSDEHFEGEKVRRSKDGRNIPILLKVAPVNAADGTLLGYVGSLTDLSAVKAAEAALRENEARLRQSQRIAAVGHWTYDPASDQFTSSEAIERIFGVEPGHPWKARDFLQRVHPQDRPRVARSLKTLPKEMLPWDDEFRIVRARDQEVRWLHVIGQPELNWNGQLLRLVGVSQDITERKLAELALQDSLHFARELIEVIPGPVFYKDRADRYLGCNQAFERFIGKERGQIIGRTPREIAPKALAERYENADRALFERPGNQVYESSVRAADGSLREVIFHKATFTKADGSVGGLVGMILDISERKRMEAQLQHSLDEFNKLVSRIRVGVFKFRTSDDGRLSFEYVSPRWCEMAGLNAEEIYADASQAFQLAHPEERASFLAAITAAHQTCQPFRWDGRMVNALGTSWLHIEADPTRLNDGEIRWDGSQYDITERKLMADALQFSLDEFNHLVTRIPVGIYKLRYNAASGYRFDYVSPRWCELLGLGVDEVYRDAGTAFNRIHPQDLDQFLRLNDLSREQLSPFEWEGRALVDGQTRWLHVKSAPTRLDDGDFRWEGIQYDITDRKQAQSQLELMSYALNHAREAIYLSDNTRLRFNYVNDEACRMLGYSREELLGMTVFDIDPLYTLADQETIRVDLDLGHTVTIERQHRRKDGHFLPVEIVVSFLRFEGHAVALSLVRDISERKKTETALRLAASVFEHANEGICITGPDERIIDVNPTFCELTGYSREQAIGQTPRLLKSGHQSPEFYAGMWRSLARQGHWRGEVWNRRASGELYAERLTVSAVRDAEGDLTHYVGVLSDITALKAHESQLERIAHYDALTGIPNRVLLADRMHQAIGQTQRAHSLLAICYLDLDGFKPINDTYGHEAGDRLLVEMAERLRGCLRGGDTVARLGGDEFVLLFQGLEHVPECESALQRILQAVNRPAQVEQHPVVLSASIGVSLYPLDDADPDTLLRHADQAMYRAKQSGKNRYHFFDPESERQARAHHESLSRLSQALDASELVLHYQPKVNLREGKVVGAEALLRWQHPQRGLLPPGSFLPLVEDAALLTRLGEWVIAEALEQMQTWRQAGLLLPVSVNIAAQHLQQPEFGARLGELMAKHADLPAGSLELEVLESAALRDIQQISNVLETCRGFGVTIALDDFGTGYSSLTYFRGLPADTLKIDQSFVRDMLNDTEDLAIVEGVIGLTEVFGRTVIAEGVETVGQGVVLLSLGCELAQGYAIARPMPAENMPDWVRDWRSDPAWQASPRWPREDLPLIIAEYNHRHWVEAVVAMIEGEAPAELPSFNPEHCRFGRWYRQAAHSRYARLPAFAVIGPLHDQVHQLAGEIITLIENQQQAQIRHRLAELLTCRDQLIAGLHTLLSDVARA